MDSSASIVLPILYLPPISWWKVYTSHAHDEVLLESKENMQKQTLRNRTQIYGANGKLNLTVPLKRTGRRIVDEIEISYREDWQTQHWKSIKNVYQASAFFEYYEDRLKEFYSLRPALLMEFNLHAIKILADLLKTEPPEHLTAEYRAEGWAADYRNAFASKGDSQFAIPRYFQTFEEKFGFLKDLSVLDLLCNEGPQSLSFINNINPF